MAPCSGTRKKTSLAASAAGTTSLARYASLLGALLVSALRALLGLAARASEQRFGQYTLHEKIGEGGMGVVFRATHALLQRPAAVKLLAAGHDRPESRERFEREAELTSRLSHPNTVAVYDFGRTSSGTPFYAMEYLDGLDLETLVDRHGPQEPSRVAHLLAQLAGALAEAHGLGLVHRDVKPANVMLCERGGTRDVVKVLDFGLTKELGTERDDSDGGRVVGTPLYLAPEAILTPERVDARSDLYALGAVGYFLLAGAPPFSGKTVAEACAHHLHTAPLPLPRDARVPPALEALVLRCLAKSPEDRPESAAVVRAELLELASTWTEQDAAAWWAEHDDGLSSQRQPRVLEVGGRTELAPTRLALAG